MNKHTFLAITLLFATFQAYAADVTVTESTDPSQANVNLKVENPVVHPTLTQSPEIGSLTGSTSTSEQPKVITPSFFTQLQAAFNAEVTAMQNEPLAQGISSLFNATTTNVKNGLSSITSTVVAVPAFVGASVIANKRVLAAIAVATVGGYYVYKYATSKKATKKVRIA